MTRATLLRAASIRAIAGASVAFGTATRAGAQQTTDVIPGAPRSGVVPGARQQAAMRRWHTPPQVMRTPTGDTVYVDQPRPVRLPGGTALFGFPTIAKRNGGIVAFGAGVVSAGGPAVRIIPLPPGHGVLRAPVTAPGSGVGAARGAAAVAHVLWSSRRSFEPGQVDTLWYAWWDGARWSAPERVWSGLGLRWDQGTMSELLVRDHRLDIYVPSDLPDVPGSGVLHLSRAQTGWRAAPVRVPGTQPGHLAAVAVRNGASHLLAFIGAMRLPDDPAREVTTSGSRVGASVGTGPVDRNSVFVAEVTPDADSVAAVRRLYSGLKDRAQEVSMVAEPRGVITVVWLTDREDSTSRRTTLRGTRSSDGGASFRPIEPQDVHGSAQGLRLFTTAKGHVGLTLSATFPAAGAQSGAERRQRTVETIAPGCSAEPDAGSDTEMQLIVGDAAPSGRFALVPLRVHTATIAAAFDDRDRTAIVWSAGAAPGALPHSCAGRP